MFLILVHVEFYKIIIELDWESKVVKRYEDKRKNTYTWKWLLQVGRCILA